MADVAGSCSSGLVPSKTSRTGGRVVGVVTSENTHRARLKRMRRSVLNASRCLVRARRGFRDRWLMVTLTYAESTLWDPKQLAAFFHRVRMWFARKGLKATYVWVLELTKRGRPHYHVLIRLPVSVRLPRPDDVGWWPHGSTRTEQARGAVGYIAKYASKGGERADFPKGARLHGSAGLTPEGRIYVQFWNLPVWCREQLENVTRVKRVAGGFVVAETGQFLPTPFQVVFRAGSILIVLKETQS